MRTTELRPIDLASHKLTAEQTSLLNAALGNEHIYFTAGKQTTYLWCRPEQAEYLLTQISLLMKEKNGPGLHLSDNHNMSPSELISFQNAVITTLLAQIHQMKQKSRPHHGHIKHSPSLFDLPTVLDRGDFLTSATSAPHP